jgi:hypothetical protein
MFFDSTNFKRPNDASAGSINEPADFQNDLDIKVTHTSSGGDSSTPNPSSSENARNRSQTEIRRPLRPSSASSNLANNNIAASEGGGRGSAARQVNGSKPQQDSERLDGEVGEEKEDQASGSPSLDLDAVQKPPQDAVEPTSAAASNPAEARNSGAPNQTSNKTDRDAYYKDMESERKDDELNKNQENAPLDESKKPASAGADHKQKDPSSAAASHGNAVHTPPAGDMANKAQQASQLANKAGKVSGDAANIAEAAQILTSDGSLKDKLKQGVNLAATEGANVALEGATAGFVGMSQENGVRYIRFGQGIKIRLSTLILIAIGTNLISWTFMIFILFASITYQCESINYTVLGVNVGYKIASVAGGAAIPGLDVEALCTPLTNAAKSIISGGVIGGGGGDAPGAGQCAVSTGAEGKLCDAGCDSGAKVKCVANYDSFINEAASQYGIDPNMIRAIIQQETVWRPNLGSPKGAVGLMQILPSTWKSIGCPGENYFDPRSNILCGAKYLKNVSDELTKKFGASIGRDIRYISAAYNAGSASSCSSKLCPFEPSPACPGKFAWECAFSDSSQNVCTTNGWKETRNYSASVSRFYTDYSSGVCPVGVSS